MRKLDRVLLHIGHPKTGTSTLQRTMHLSRRALIRGGILVPDRLGFANHNFLLPHLTGDPATAINAQLSVAQSRAHWDKICQQIDQTGARTMVLSAEEMFSLQSARHLRALRENLQAIADHIDVIAYVREPAAFALSLAQQDLTWGGQIRPVSPTYYSDTLKPFAAAQIGPVHVRPFARKALTGGSIVSDFFNQYLPEFDQSKLKHIRDANTSGSAEAMALLQEINLGERATPNLRVSRLKRLLGRSRQPNIRRVLQKADRRLAGFKRPALHTHVTQAARAQCQDYDWLQEKFGVPLLSGTEPLPSPEEAAHVLANISRVNDMCPVDETRKEALWAKLS